MQAVGDNPHITELSLGSVTIDSDDACRAIGGLTNLKQVHLVQCAFGDNCKSAMLQLPSTLVWLTVVDTEVDVVSLIAASTSLHTLCLDTCAQVNAKTIDGVLERAKSLATLELADLPNVSTSDLHNASWSRSHIKTLLVMGTYSDGPVSSTFHKHVAATLRLESHSISDGKTLSRDILASLVGNGLRKLVVGQRNDGLCPLDFGWDLLSQLEELVLYSTSVTGAVEEEFRNAPRLRRLSLYGCKVANLTLGHLSSFDSLRELNVEYSEITCDVDESPVIVIGEKLTTLSVAYTSTSTGAGLRLTGSPAHLACLKWNSRDPAPTGLINVLGDASGLTHLFLVVDAFNLDVLASEAVTLANLRVLKVHELDASKAAMLLSKHSKLRVLAAVTITDGEANLPQLLEKHRGVSMYWR